MKIIAKTSVVAIFCVQVFSALGMRVGYAQPSYTLASYLDYSNQLFLQANPQIDLQSLAMHNGGGLLMQYDKVAKAGVATFKLPNEKELPSLTEQEAQKIKNYFKVSEIKMVDGHCVILFNYTDERLLPQNKLQAALLLLRPTLNDIPFATESSNHFFLSELQRTAIFTANQPKSTESSFASESQHENECKADLLKGDLLQALKMSSHSVLATQKPNTAAAQPIDSINKNFELPQMVVSQQKEGAAKGLTVLIDQILELKGQEGFASRAVTQGDSDCKKFEDIQLNDQVASGINTNIPAPLAFYMQQRDQCKIDLSKGSLIYIYKIGSTNSLKREKQVSASDQKINMINRNLEMLHALGTSQKRVLSEALNYQIDELWEMKASEGFAVGTLVKTESSYQKIEDIKPGQMVIAYDAQKQELTSRKVLNTYNKHVLNYVQITFNGTTIHTAVDQKLYIHSKELYVTAEELSKSLELQAVFSTPITDIQLINAETDICMLTVEDDHNFFVSEQDVLAHNIAPLFVLVPLAAPAAVGAATIIIPAIKFAGFAVGGWVATKFFASFIYRPKTNESIHQDHEIPKYMGCGNDAGSKDQNGPPKQNKCNPSYETPKHKGCGNDAGPKDQNGPQQKQQCNHSKETQRPSEQNNNHKNNDEKKDSKSKPASFQKEDITHTKDNNKQKKEKSNKNKGGKSPEQDSKTGSKLPQKTDNPTQPTKHQNGVYEGAPYHNQNSKGDKSPAPKNGQKALDESIPANPDDGPGGRRVSVDEGEIVVLDSHAPGKYHGHVRDYDTLPADARRELHRHKKVNLRGKILK